MQGTSHSVIAEDGTHIGYTNLGPGWVWRACRVIGEWLPGPFANREEAEEAVHAHRAESLKAAKAANRQPAKGKGKAK